MPFQSQNERNIPVLIPEGRFDAYQATPIDEWFTDAIQKHHFIVVDLSAVNFMDTRAIATLVKWMKKCREQSGDLKLCSLQNPIRVILELSKLNKAFAIFETRDEAIEACETGQVNTTDEEPNLSAKKAIPMSDKQLPNDLEIIKLDKRVDAFRVAELQKSFEAMALAGKCRFVVDLSKVDFLDSAGLALLVKLLKQAKSANGNVVLVRSEKDTANRILKLTQFDKVFTISDTLEAAVIALLG